MKKNLLLFLCFFCLLKLNAQNKIYWKILSESDVNKNDIWSNKFKPVDYKIFHLDETEIMNALSIGGWTIHEVCMCVCFLITRLNCRVI